MVTSQRKMVLGAYITYAYGHHPAAWRVSNYPVSVVSSYEYYCNLAQKAEQGNLDFIFLADTPSVLNDEIEGRSGRVVGLEPITLLSAIATRTSRIGLIATGSTTFNEPYNWARQIASLDHISGGRAGWNIVTSSKSQAAMNFGLNRMPDHNIRYLRAEEFVDVTCKLWECWPPETFINDVRQGLYYDPKKRNHVCYSGTYIKVNGELNVAQPPQGRPLLVQAGASEEGMQLGARWADLIFTAASNFEDASLYKEKLEFFWEKNKRNNSKPLVLPGVSIYGGKTRGEARARFNNLKNMIHPEHAVSMLSDQLGVDLTDCNLEQPLSVTIPKSEGNQSKRKRIIDYIQKNPNLSLQDLAREIALSRSHLILIDSWENISNTLIDWFNLGVCDGFNLMPPIQPNDLIEYIEYLVPLLQRKNVFPSQPRIGNLRERFTID